MDPYGYGADDYARARDALARYRPEPVTDDRIRAGLEFVRQGLSMAWMHQLRTCGTADRRRHTEDLDSLLASRLNIEEKPKMASYSASPAAGSYVDAKALGQTEHLVTVASYEQRTFEEQNRDGTRYMNTKIVLAFEHRNKKWIMPKICSAMMANTFGDEMDGWVGRQIILFVDPNIPFGNKIVAGVRWKLPVAQGASAGFQQPAQTAAAMPGDGAMQQPAGPPPDPGATAPAGMTPGAPPATSTDDYGAAWGDDEIPF